MPLDNTLCNSVKLLMILRVFAAGRNYNGNFLITSGAVLQESCPFSAKIWHPMKIKSPELHQDGHPGDVV